MIRINILIFLQIVIFFSIKSSAQNLAPNPSFEIYSFCPTSQGNINTATGWTSYGSTPDYFNSCAAYTVCWVNQSFSVPFNYAGYQTAATGQGYCGFGTYIDHAFAQNGREFIGGQLISPLVTGNRYYISFKVCLSKATCFNSGWATNKIGVRFSMNAYSQFSPPSLNNFAHVYTDSIIKDTSNWTTIRGSFIADSNYKYLSIGNFFDDTNTNIASFSTPHDCAYYFLDDFIVGVDSLTELTGLTPFQTQDNGGFEVSPNPANDFLNVSYIMEGVQKEFTKAEILNHIGQLLMEVNLTFFDKQETLDIKELPAGVYLINLKGDQVQIMSRRFIVAKGE